MDRYAVLVFHDQPIDDAQQLAFSHNFGPIEPAVNNVSLGEGAAHRPQHRRYLEPEREERVAGA